MTNGAILAPAEMEADGTDTEIARETSEIGSGMLETETETEKETEGVTDRTRATDVIRDHVSGNVAALVHGIGHGIGHGTHIDLPPRAVHTSLLGMILLSHLIP